MTEKNCPLCHKPLVNGKCEDCGYYEDNYLMDNQKKEYYTEYKNIGDKVNEPNSDYQNIPKEKKSTPPMMPLKIVLLVVAPILAFILIKTFSRTLLSALIWIGFFALLAFRIYNIIKKK